MDHPVFKQSYSDCDAKVYGPGVTIDGNIYTSKKDVFSKIRPLLTRSRTKEESETLHTWSQEWQPAFIACLAKAGFVFNAD